MRKLNLDVFTSVFAGSIVDYLKMKERHGFQMESYYYQLKAFDIFCRDKGIDSPVFTALDAREWEKREEYEGSRRYAGRINITRNFLLQMEQLGYDVFTGKAYPYKPSDFQPHIYSEDEIARYFEALDAFECRKAPLNAIQFPVMFRLFYCCGTRLNETLCIKKKDVNLKEGIIRLHETKNHKERMIVLGNDLKELMISYAEKFFYNIRDDGYIFTSSRGDRYSKDRIYTVHRIILERAGIPFLGEKKGPRIHDWRHTFAVSAFRQMADSAMDMYTSLPILSAYLGHENIYATEKYLRLTMALYPYIEEKWHDQMETVFGKQEVPHEK